MKTRAGGFAHLVFFEPGILWSDTTIAVPPAFAHDDGVVFAPHIYRGGLTSGPVERSDFERARNDAATFGGAPVFVGEWGSGPERAEDPNDVYFRTHQQLQDEFHFSATLWTWRESCGDPHKAGDARAGRIPSVWGEWEVDCRTNTVTGPRQALVDQLSRPVRTRRTGPLDDHRVRPGERRVHRIGPRRARRPRCGRVVPDAAARPSDDHDGRSRARVHAVRPRRRRVRDRHDDRRRVAPCSGERNADDRIPPVSLRCRAPRSAARPELGRLGAGGRSLGLLDHVRSRPLRRRARAGRGAGERGRPCRRH